MEEKKTEQVTVTEEKTQSAEELREAIKAVTERIREKSKEANEAIRSAKGRLTLEKPILCRDEPVNELPFDLTTLTGLDYIEAMDGDPNALNAFKITYRQALTLFARAAAKETEGLDARDIIERIGVTDALEAVQVTTLFFNASTRAGRLRISKK